MVIEAIKTCVRNTRKYYTAYKKENMKKLRVGFIGCGNHAITNIYPCLRFCPVTLEAVCSLHEITAKRTAQWFGAKRWYINYEEMIAKEKLDAVFIVVNKEKHKEIAAHALSKGLHVFVEKSPALSESDIDVLAALSKKAEKICMVGYQKRYAPTYEKAKEIMQSSVFGKTHTIFFYCTSGGQGSENEFLYELGIHGIDLLRWLAGDVRKILVDKSYQYGYSCIIHILFENGCKGILFLTNTQSWNHPTERLEIYGNKERAIINNLYNVHYYKKTRCVPGKIPEKNELEEVWCPNATVPNTFNQSIFLNGYGYEVMAFIEGIRGTEKKVRTTIEESRQNIKIIERILVADASTPEWINIGC